MKPVLYLFVGYPGAGKTTVAQIVAQATGGVHLWADQERHKRFGEATHTVAESSELYRQLNDETAQLLSEGKTVIFDTNFNFFADRENLRRIATKHGAVTRLIWVTTPEQLAKDRATAQTRNGYNSKMSLEQFSSITSKLEVPSDDELPYIIDGTLIDKTALLKDLDLN